MEDEMDIGEDLVEASDQSKPFDLSMQNENLSELEEIGFADSAALEAEAVDMDPEEQQKRELFKKQQEAVEMKKEELQKKVEEQKQKLVEAQKQLDEQLNKQKEIEKQNQTEIKKHRQSLAQLAAKAKQKSIQQEQVEEMKFEQDMF